MRDSDRRVYRELRTSRLSVNGLGRYPYDSYALHRVPIRLTGIAREAHAIFQTVNITVVLMVAGDRVIQRVPRELTWVTKDYLT